MNAPINQLEPAFPRSYSHDGHNGMTLRDYFAAQAIGHLIIAANGHAVNRDDIAAEAYKQADAMLAYREHPMEVQDTQSAIRLGAKAIEDLDRITPRPLTAEDQARAVLSALANAQDQT